MTTEEGASEEGAAANVCVNEDGDGGEQKNQKERETMRKEQIYYIYKHAKNRSDV